MIEVGAHNIGKQKRKENSKSIAEDQENVENQASFSFHGVIISRDCGWIHPIFLLYHSCSIKSMVLLEKIGSVCYSGEK